LVHLVASLLAASLQAAKKLPKATVFERYLIFVREQDHIQKAFAACSGGDDSTADLASYIELQRNFNLVVQMHTDALIARRTLWETLLHSNVTFCRIESAMQQVDKTARAAQQMYRRVLSRHSSNAKIVALYVKFLEGVRNDPWAAARWATELEKLEKSDEEASDM
jgi:hypothetical protein